MRGNLLARDEKGNLTAGVIGDDTANNDIKFFAGPEYNFLSPTTKQNLICVRDTINKDNPSQIFVRYPSLDTKATGRKIDNEVYQLWDAGNYEYNYPGFEYQYYDTVEYEGSTYYMWKLKQNPIGKFIVVLTEERDYRTKNLQYYNNDFSLTPKIVASLNNDQEYGAHNSNLTYIVNATSNSIYVDDFYDAYAWVLDSGSADVSLYNYHNGSRENLDTTVVIYTDSENVIINDVWGCKISPTKSSTYKVIDASTKDDIKNSAFRVYEDGTVYMSNTIIDTGGSIKSSFIEGEFRGNVTMSGGTLIYNVTGNNQGGTAIIGYRSEKDKALISLYPTQEDPGLYISALYDSIEAIRVDKGFVSINNDSYITLNGNSYIESYGNGAYKGFKTPIVRIQIGREYNIDDIQYHTIVTYANGITLKTSQNPKTGEEYDIYVWNYNVTLNLNGKGALKLVNGTATEYGVNNTIITLSKNTYYHIVYDGICWFIHQ